MRKRTILLAAPFLAGLAVSPLGPAIGHGEADRPVPLQDGIVPGTPVVRDIEHVLNRASQEPGPFKSIGYLTYVRGLDPHELFDIPPGAENAPMDESNARFSIVQEGRLLRTVPSSFVPPRPGESNSFSNALARGPETIYYDPHPRRDWTKPESFKTGQVVAVWDTKLSTTALDLSAGVGTGTDEGVRTSSRRFTLASGRTFDFAELGSHVFADLQFQLRTGVTSPDPELPLVVNESELWRHAP